MRELTRTQVPLSLTRRIEEIHASLDQFPAGCVAEDPHFQTVLAGHLTRFEGWNELIARTSRTLVVDPVVIGAGLRVARNTRAARLLLVALARALAPGGRVPVYSAGNQAVTEVTAIGNASHASHSMNDLPAPFHSAGFFEPVPPLLNLFACVRPHPGGGAATLVVDLPRVLERASPALLARLAGPGFWYFTSRRLGGATFPLRPLSRIGDRPFLRYRREYTLTGASATSAMDELQALIDSPDNQLSASLRADEILVHHNGAPHARTPQDGPTPERVQDRRLLIRCRALTPEWEAHFRRQHAAVGRSAAAVASW